MEWPSGQKYMDFLALPTDCGFVAMLMYLKELRVFKTEVGARAVVTLNKIHTRRQRKMGQLKLKLESLTDSYPNPTNLEIVGQCCPRLHEFRVNWDGAM